MTLPAIRATGTMRAEKGGAISSLSAQHEPRQLRTAIQNRAISEIGNVADFNNGTDPRLLWVKAVNKPPWWFIDNVLNETGLKAFAGLLADALQKETICDADLPFCQFCSRLLS